jgi:SET domain-containing protein
MALLEKYLVVKDSLIPGAGKGLYTKKIIPKGTRIVEYKGKVSKWNDVDHQGGLNAYIYYVNKNHVIDGSSTKNLARYANDAKGIKKIESLSNNCKYFQDDHLHVFIQSIKDIPANSEILVGYGKKYWEVLMENRKKVKKEQKKKRRTG